MVDHIPGYRKTGLQRDKEDWRKSEPQKEVEIEDNFERKKEISISAYFRFFVPYDVNYSQFLVINEYVFDCYAPTRTCAFIFIFALLFFATKHV